MKPRKSLINNNGHHIHIYIYIYKEFCVGVSKQKTVLYSPYARNSSILSSYRTGSVFLNSNIMRKHTCTVVHGC